MTTKGTEEYASKLSKLGAESVEIAKKVVKAGAAPVADEIRKNLGGNLAGSEYTKGSLLGALGITSPQVDKDGNTNVKIGFSGYDTSKTSVKYPSGTPQVVKARAMESGTSKQKKKPFVRPAVNKTKTKAIEEMGRVLDEEISKLV